MSATRFRTTDVQEGGSNDAAFESGVYEVAGALESDPLALTDAEKEAFLADTKGEQQPEDEQALAVWKARQEMKEFEKETREARSKLTAKLKSIESALVHRRTMERFDRFARFGATLLQAGFDDETATALKRVPPADLVTLIHTLAEREMTVQDLLRQMQLTGRA
jgi:hypothetical protein